jgi:lysophospholipase L1-like esterase
MRLERPFIFVAVCHLFTANVQANTLPALAISDSVHVPWECPDSSEAFGRLWSTMDSIQSHQSCTLTILYIGGSHVQSGWIGHEMRRSLAKWAPQAEMSRGMHLPYRLAQTNTPTHFRTEFSGHWTASRCTRSIGQAPCEAAPIATGILAYPAGVATIQHVSYLPDSSRTACSALEIWTNAQRSQWRWTGNAALDTCYRLADQLGWQLKLAAPADTLALTFFAQEANDVWYAGMSDLKTSSRSRIAFHEWGHNGLRARHAAALDGWEALLQRVQPDLIFVGIGLNDAVDGERLNLESFAAYYAALTSELRASGAAIVLLGNTPAAYGHTSLAKPSKLIGSWLQQHSASNAMTYLDVTTALGGPDIPTEWMENGRMQPDGMHFTAAGYAAFARVLFEAWISAYSDAKKAPSLNGAADTNQE